jgi:regulator of protease activity HflC (stomatin/prohibitin superfamily)
MENMDMQTKLVEIGKDVEKITASATKVVIKSAADMTGASELLKQVVARKKRIEELRLFFTKPLNDHIKDINASFKRTMGPLEAIDSDIRGKMVAYRQVEAERLEKERQKEAERQRKAFEKEQEKKRQEAAKLKGAEKKEALQEIKQETFVADTTAIKQSTAVESDSGKTSFSKVWEYEIINEGLIPRKYLKVDERLIGQAVRSGGIREIPGVRIYETERPSVR